MALIRHWLMDGHPEDYLGNGVDLVNVDTVSKPYTGLIGSSYRFDGTGYLETDWGLNRTSGNITFTGWFKIDNNCEDKTLFGPDNSSSPNTRFYVAKFDNDLRMGYGSHNWNLSEHSSFNFSEEPEWTHVIMSSSTTNCKLYVNGKLIQTIEHVPFTLASNFIIGVNGISQNGNYNFTGNAFDCRIYDNSVTAEEALALYKEPLLNVNFQNVIEAVVTSSVESDLYLTDNATNADKIRIPISSLNTPLPIWKGDKNLVGVYGTKGYLDLSNNSSMSLKMLYKHFSNNCTLNTVISVDDLNIANKQYIFSQGLNSDNSFSIYILNKRLVIDLGNLVGSFEIPTALSEDTTHFISVSLSNNTLSVFIDNFKCLDTTFTFSGIYNPNISTPLYIGCSDISVTSEPNSIAISDLIIQPLKFVREDVDKCNISLSRPSTKFNAMFQNASNVKSSVPTLWNNNRGLNGVDCYEGVESAENTSRIPLAWGGDIKSMTATIGVGVAVEELFQMPTIETLTADVEDEE